MKLDELINSIIENEDGEKFRIINIDYVGKVANFINTNEKLLPQKIEIENFIEQINNGKFKILDDDKYIVGIRECDLKDSEKKYRDKIFNIIYPIISNNTINLYNKKQLSGLIKDIAKENKLSTRTVKRYLIRYLVRGQNKNALILDYYRCGCLNKEKKLSNKKTGRPRVYNLKAGEGINVTDEIKLIFEQVIDDLYKDRQNKKSSGDTPKLKLSQVYDLMIGKYFKDDNGEVKPENELPTIGQFRYWYNKRTKFKVEYKSNKSKKEYNLRIRPLIGTSLDKAQYPTGTFQIDSTQGDIKIVSTFNRSNVIGNPTIYIVIDVFSRMITGYYAGLENASWSAAMMAIYNCTINKVDFCKYYGVDIKDDEWNSCDLPDVIVCDKGSEFTGENIENMANYFNIEIKNAPPYRPDLKGIVESFFRKLNSEFKTAPGSFKSQIRERGEENPVEVACLDINQINRIIISCIINHNNKYMNNYRRTSTMIEDNVECIPSKIWNWGMENLVGYKPKLGDDYIKLGLIPRDKASVTDRGIKFKNMYYICDEAINEGWFETARTIKRWKVDIAYDPRNLNKIYLIKNKKREYTICSLKKSEDRYLDKTYDEINSLNTLEQELKAEYKYNNLKNEVKKNDRILTEVKLGKKMSKAYKIKTGKTKNNTKQIRENRKIEKKRLEENQSLKLGNNSEISSENGAIIENEIVTYNENHIKAYDIQDEFSVDEAYRNRKNKLNKKFHKVKEKNLNKGDV